MNYKEIEIPVPWGIIAAKTCGDENDEIIIAIHGFQDNANSFDCLIPHLEKSFYYVCIDLPSHGKSSHLISKSLLSPFDFVLSLKLVVDYFNRKNYILMGHSFGVQTSVFFAQVYPELVTKLICLDAIYFIPLEPSVLVPRIEEMLSKYQKLINLSIETAPVYTLEEAIDRARNFRFVPMTEKVARILIERSLVPVGDNKFRFTTAQHLKYYSRPAFSQKYQIELFKKYPIRCPFLVIGASESKIYRVVIRNSINHFKKNKFFEMHVVEGNHDVHMEHPERVAPFINKLLKKKTNKL